MYNQIPYNIIITMEKLNWKMQLQRGSERGAMRVGVICTVKLTPTSEQLEGLYAALNQG